MIMPRKKKEEDVAQVTNFDAEAEAAAKVDPKEEYRKTMTAHYKTFGRGDLVDERDRLFDTIRSRMGDATWPVQCRYKIVCELLKGMGIS